MKKIFIMILITTTLLISGCSKEDNMNIDTSNGILDGVSYKETSEITNYVKIVMESNDVILLELLPEYAPITVENFQSLVEEKFYDGLIFHRVIENFMIQTGDPEGTGIGGSDKTIKGEFELNDVQNDLSHKRGVISMARKGAVPDTSETMNSASSQFFIVHADSEYLDGNYAAFGNVIAGMSTVDKIAGVDVNSSDKPIVNQVMKDVRFVEIEKNNE